MIFIRADAPGFERPQRHHNGYRKLLVPVYRKFNHIQKKTWMAKNWKGLTPVSSYQWGLSYWLNTSCGEFGDRFKIIYPASEVDDSRSLILNIDTACTSRNLPGCEALANFRSLQTGDLTEAVDCFKQCLKGQKGEGLLRSDYIRDNTVLESASGKEALIAFPTHTV